MEQAFVPVYAIVEILKHVLRNVLINLGQRGNIFARMYVL